MVPVYVFGQKADLGAVTGENSRYRDPEKIKAGVRSRAREHGQSAGRLRRPERSLPGAERGDRTRGQACVHRLVRRARLAHHPGRGDRQIGQGLHRGQRLGAVLPRLLGQRLRSVWLRGHQPTHDKSIQDVDRQLVTIPPDSLGGGYDARIAGPNPWTLGPLGSQAPGYFKGQSADEADRAGVRAAGRVLHAYTDSSQSAAELVSGVKSYNSGLNIADDSRLVTTLFHELQDQGWKAGTVTSVPFCHASPAGMYAQNVERDDYQDIARAMLGLPGIIQEARQARLYPGLDVVIGTGYGINATSRI